jgi:Reverse transcriptase (RNA-dependent DNA polymerase)
MTAVGPGEIRYQMLKHLPYTALSSLLHILNCIWQNGSFPSSWSEATIFPLPKPDKDHTCHSNYMPIALASCLCKTFESIVNNRLTWYLETSNRLTELQGGFRRGRSTTDQLVRLESFVHINSLHHLQYILFADGHAAANKQRRRHRPQIMQ